MVWSTLPSKEKIKNKSLTIGIRYSQHTPFMSKIEQFIKKKKCPRLNIYRV